MVLIKVRFGVVVGAIIMVRVGVSVGLGLG